MGPACEGVQATQQVCGLGRARCNLDALEGGDVREAGSRALGHVRIPRQDLPNPEQGVERQQPHNQEGGGQAAGGPSGQGAMKQVADSTGGGPDVMAL